MKVSKNLPALKKASTSVIESLNAAATTNAVPLHELLAYVTICWLATVYENCVDAKVENPEQEAREALSFLLSSIEESGRLTLSFHTLTTGEEGS